MCKFGSVLPVYGGDCINYGTIIGILTRTITGDLQPEHCQEISAAAECTQKTTYFSVTILQCLALSPVLCTACRSLSQRLTFFFAFCFCSQHPTGTENLQGLFRKTVAEHSKLSSC